MSTADDTARRQQAYAALGLGPRWVVRPGGALGGWEGEGRDQDEADVAITGPAPLPAAPEPGAAGQAPFADAGQVPPSAAGQSLLPADAPAPVRDVDEQAVVSTAAAPVPVGAEPEAVPVALLGWDELRARVSGCRACGLCKTRTQTVFGVGPQSARWMLIGEAPGAEEDARGEPFVGKAGRLLDSMLASIGLSRERDVFIANVLKCRPPRNRDPQPDEIRQCEPFLFRQIELVSPDVVLLFGRFSAQLMLGTDASISSLRGRRHALEVAGRQVPAVVTYHPAYLLRTPHDKAKSWRDLLLARRIAAEHQGG